VGLEPMFYLAFLVEVDKKMKEIFFLIRYLNNRQRKTNINFDVFNLFFYYTRCVRAFANARGSGKGIGCNIDIEFDVEGVFIVS
jgi:hypothetical protein